MLDMLTADVISYGVYGGAFLGVLLVFTGIAQLVRFGESRSEARSRRMKMIAAGVQTEDILALLKPAPQDDPLLRLPLLSGLPTMLSQAGLVIPARRFLVFCLLGTAVMLLAGAMVLPMFAAVALAVAVGLLLPVLVLKQRRDARVDKLVRQLPDALELMARALKVGHPLNTSIQAVAVDMPDPIGTEFGLIFDQISFGTELPDAFQDFADRIQIEDIQYLSASIAIQYGSGGDLARVLSILSMVVRDRLTMRRKIKSISSEGRLSSYFLSALPVAIFGLTMLTSPEYYTGVMDDPMFKPMIGAIVTFTILNFLILRKLVNFRF